MPAAAAPAAPNQYDLARQRASDSANQSAQSNNDAIRRRFASLGNLNSGAAIKQQQIAQDQANQDKTQQIASIDAAQAGEQSQRDFANQQMKAQQDFQAGQSGLDRAQQEKLQNQGFAFTGGQSALERALQQQMQQSGFAFTGGQNELQRQQEAQQFGQTFSKEYGDGTPGNTGLKGRALDLQQQELEANKAIAQINAKIAAAGISDDDWRNVLTGQLSNGMFGQNVPQYTPRVSGLTPH